MSKFLKVIVNLFLLCAIAVAAAILVPPLMGISTVVVDSTSMDTNLPMGSVTYAKDVNVTNLINGDKVLNENDSKTYEYVIQDGDAASGAYTVVDARNTGAEATTITLRNFVPKVVITVPLIGYVVMAMQSLEGIIIIGLVVLFVIILFILSELWKKSDDDDEDDDEEDYDEQPAQAIPSQNVQQLIDTPIVPEPVAVDITLDDVAPKKQAVDSLVENMDGATQTVSQETKNMDPDQLIRESQAELAAAVAMANGKQPEQEVLISEAAEPDVPAEEKKEIDFEIFEVQMPDLETEPEEDPDTFVPIPRATLDELMKKAQEDGDQPNVVKDEQTGVTILDYSDIV